MITTSQGEASFFHLLLRWVTYRLAQTMAAIAPVHRAGEIAAAAAASNNPSGA
ncbi:hypothetical protein [Bradyrhizobium sp. Arg816]|uniref:hypothetical protein n=1 Tax=Bradyrhizobium sp. Arg816 TaxID=2998491 RepID=UPI00249DF227|nr:hypothetical protein [Bradyrhizobium sp. Arg816]MDI3560314.1 hypothetical protein [Bradyrhizobium sp. Arg816]